MNPYAHLNKEERKILAVLQERGDSLRSIARTLKRSPATVSRELKRNLTQRHYHPLRAEFLSRLRHEQCHRKERLKNPALRAQVEADIRKRWSPEIIAGRLAREKGFRVISHEAIYQWIYRDAPHLIRCLPRHHFKRYFRSSRRVNYQIPGRRFLSERPFEAQSRQQPGHWEVDLMVGKGTSALKVLVERKTRFTRLSKVCNKTPHASFLTLSRILASIPSPLRISLTYDNGTENALHRELNSRFQTQSFFCRPFSWWEKPTVENTIGLIRWFLPKRSNLDIIPDQKILEIETWLNSRPRKCLKFLTPSEALGVALNG